MAKNTKLTEKNVDELKKMLAEMREDLRATRFAAAGSRPKDSDAHSRIRKDIARVLYELGMRSKAASAAATPAA
ncbi:MAG TPA: 50S ribosomal protein L29 [Candidatus Paceibacterota bacterium]|jgi:ribosomal protein L29|nr:50S ribosomal protein L29 [Candidatus Paceibacterota bacterium]